MKGYNYAIRRYNRHVKATRRLREDRAEHGTVDLNRRFVCACFMTGDKATNGKAFARFADYPAECSSWCCGNPRRHESGKYKLTRQELRAPRADEWE